MTRFQPPRGTRDFMPEDMLRREHIFSTVRKVFERFGFRPLDTPAFESWELLGAKGGGGEAIKDEVYLFRDKGGREVGLRFDLTVPTARVVASTPPLPKPFKRYQIGPVWRYDNPQAGRFREFYQCDADIFGVSSMSAEAECIAVFVSCLKELGFSDFVVRLNNRKVLNGMAESAGIGKENVSAVFRALDKLEKQGEAVMNSELEAAGMSARQIGALMNIARMPGRPKEMIEKARKLLGAAAKEGLDELEEILKLSDSYGTSGRIAIDFSLARGLDYYTGPIFEIVAKSKTSIGSLMGGGRYDRLVELYGGQPTPVTGASLGVERIYEIMAAEGMFGDMAATKTRVFVAAAKDDEKLKGEAVRVATRLREAGIPAETDLVGRNLKQLLGYAEKFGIPYMVIIGEKELKSGRLALRDLASRKQKPMGLADIIRALRKQGYAGTKTLLALHK